MFETKSSHEMKKTDFTLTPSMQICQSDYPLDWYQEAFIPYAQEYMALPNRKITTICEWMEPYMQKASEHFGDKLMLLAHYYMGGEIVKLIEHFGGEIGDSYQLALKAKNNPHKEVIVESAVHFMAESISILANPNQTVYITNPKSGCTMEMMAKDFMVEPALLDLNERYGKENILPICYMNTSGRVKALCGAQGGAVCTSSNVEKIARWAQKENKKIVFIPDEHMGRNVAYWLRVNKLAFWPGGSEGARYSLNQQNSSTLKQFDDAELILFKSYCAVHTFYKDDMVDYWRSQGYTTIAHPECTNDVIKAVDSSGSTSFIFDQVSHDRAGTRKYAIATENHLVQNLKEQMKPYDIDVVNMGEAKTKSGEKGIGCGCATMSRNDPPHLVATLDLLRQGNPLAENIVKPGDVVNEFSGFCERLSDKDQQWVVENAEKALQKMIEITES